MKTIVFCMWAWPLGALCQGGTFSLSCLLLVQNTLPQGPPLQCRLSFWRRAGGDEDGVLDTSPGKIHAVVGKPEGLGSAVGPDSPEG